MPPVILDSEASPHALLDTDMVSEVFKGQNPIVEAHKQVYAARFGYFEFTSASVLEILNGLHRKVATSQIQRVEILFSQNREIVPEAGDYRLGAEIAGNLSRRGTPIGLIDPLIAACAIRRGYRVATGNVAHFRFIQLAGYNRYRELAERPLVRGVALSRFAGIGRSTSSPPGSRFPKSVFATEMIVRASE